MLTFFFIYPFSDCEVFRLLKFFFMKYVEGQREVVIEERTEKEKKWTAELKKGIRFASKNTGLSPDCDSEKLRKLLETGSLLR